jgi:guanylate kinase
MEPVTPHLENKAAFEKALANFMVSQHAIDVLAKSPFVVFTGIAGGGRNTIIRALTRNANYIFVVSDTTRAPKLRDGHMEQDSIHYYFRQEADMLHDIENGEFIEAEIVHNQQVSGTSVRAFETAVATGHIPVRDFEYGGINNVANAKPDATLIALLPPSYEEWQRRLHNREEMSQEEFTHRLETAKLVLENVLNKPQFKIVINDNIGQCVATVREIVEKNIYTPEQDAEGRTIVKSILDKVNASLENKA